MEKNRCTFCQSPSHKPEQLKPFPASAPADHDWVCEKCDAATRRMDRELRAHYVKTGVIRPRACLTLN